MQQPIMMKQKKMDYHFKKMAYNVSWLCDAANRVDFE